MKVLFIIPDVFLGEPFGALHLVAAGKAAGHEVRLITLKKNVLADELRHFAPDVVAYSVMSPFKDMFMRADKVVQSHAAHMNKRIVRIMGGAHPTFFPEILEEMGLDAICIGEGDLAFVRFLESVASGGPLPGIPNILLKGQTLDSMEKEIVQDLDALPYIDRSAYFEVAPLYRNIKMRGVMTSRGCPYNCTYCHNHAFHKLFKGKGKTVRRRSVDNVLEEIRQTVSNYGPVSLMRFTDDTFAHTIDDWLLDFLKRYKREFGLPFYCLMRSNTLSRDMAFLLAEHGCVSIGMSVESGIERIRNDVLKRNLSDKMVIDSFRFAREAGLKTFGNTILAIPSGTFRDDLESYHFMRQLHMTVPTFGIFRPYPRIELTEMAIEMGLLDRDYDPDEAGEFSPLRNYTPEEKDMQTNITHLGPLFCALPDFLQPLFERIIRFKPNSLFSFLGSTFVILAMGIRIYPKAFPCNPRVLWNIFIDSLKFRNVLGSNSNQNTSQTTADGN